MSSRRLGGRFTTNTSSEAYQRQLTAPVHKWKKAWIAPQGLQPESSYKICKWVRVDTAEDTGTPGEDDDEEMEDGEEGEEGGDEEAAAAEAAEGGEGGDSAEATGEGVKSANAVAGADPTASAGEEGSTAIAKSGAGAHTATTTSDTVPQVTLTAADMEGVASANSDLSAASAPAADSTDTTIAPVATTTNAGASPTPSSTPAVIEHAHDMPSNAIEVSNTAPDSTEVGLGDLGHGGVHVTLPETSPPAEVGRTPQPAEPAEPAGTAANARAEPDGQAVREERMDVDEAPALPSSTSVAQPEAVSGDGEERAAVPESDPGLVMADHEQARKEFEVIGEDKPMEVEQEAEDSPLTE